MKQLGTLNITYANDNDEGSFPTQYLGDSRGQRTLDSASIAYANWAYFGWGGSVNEALVRKDYGLVSALAGDVDEIAECTSNSRVASSLHLNASSRSQYISEAFSERLENTGAELAFDYTMPGGVGGARLSTAFDVVRIGNVFADRNFRWSSDDVKEFSENSPESDDVWALRLRDLPMFVEESVVTNTAAPDGLALDGDWFTDRHNGKSFSAFLDGSVERIEPYIDVTEEEAKGIADESSYRPNGSVFGALAVRRLGTRRDYISQAGVGRLQLSQSALRDDLAQAEREGFGFRYGWINSPN